MQRSPRATTPSANSRSKRGALERASSPAESPAVVGSGGMGDRFPLASASNTTAVLWNTSQIWRTAAAAMAWASVATASSRLIPYSTAVRCSRASAVSRWRRMLTMRFAITRATISITPSVNRYFVSSTSKLNSGGTKK